MTRRPGRPAVDPAEAAARKAEFIALYKRLDSSPAEAAKLIGLSPATVPPYLAPNVRRWPTADAVDRLRQAVLRHLEAKETAAAAAARKAWLDRMDFEQELRA